MIWTALLLTGFAASGAPQDYPHRDWGRVATLDMTLSDATLCIAREMDREGAVLVLPADGGNDIDYSAGTLFGGSVNEAWVRFKIRPIEGAAALSIFYRHPVNQKWLRRVMRNFQKHCLKVRRIDPA